MKEQQANNPLPPAAWDYALKILARRQHSEAEMLRKLEQKGFPAGVVTATLERLKVSALLDDDRFARDWAAYRLAVHPMGRRRLQQELCRHGVPGSLAARVAGTILTPAGELDTAREIAARYRRRQGESREHYYQRLARFLWQRGFDTDVVHRVTAEFARPDIDSGA
jgi:regulatory protein